MSLFSAQGTLGRTEFLFVHAVLLVGVFLYRKFLLDLPSQIHVVAAVVLALAIGCAVRKRLRDLSPRMPMESVLLCYVCLAVPVVNAVAVLVLVLRRSHVPPRPHARRGQPFGPGYGYRHTPEMPMQSRRIRW